MIRVLEWLRGEHQKCLAINPMMQVRRSYIVPRIMSCVGSTVIAIKASEQIMHMTWTRTTRTEYSGLWLLSTEPDVFSCTTAKLSRLALFNTTYRHFNANSRTFVSNDHDALSSQFCLVRSNVHRNIRGFQCSMQSSDDVCYITGSNTMENRKLIQITIFIIGKKKSPSVPHILCNH